MSAHGDAPLLRAAFVLFAGLMLADATVSAQLAPPHVWERIAPPTHNVR